MVLTINLVTTQCSIKGLGTRLSYSYSGQTVMNVNISAWRVTVGRQYTLSPRFCLITSYLWLIAVLIDHEHMEAAIVVIDMHDKNSLVSGYW